MQQSNGIVAVAVDEQNILYPHRRLTETEYFVWQVSSEEGLQCKHCRVRLRRCIDPEKGRQLNRGETAKRHFDACHPQHTYQRYTEDWVLAKWRTLFPHVCVACQDVCTLQEWRARHALTPKGCMLCNVHVRTFTANSRNKWAAAQRHMDECHPQHSYDTCTEYNVLKEWSLRFEILHTEKKDAWQCLICQSLPSKCYDYGELFSDRLVFITHLFTHFGDAMEAAEDAGALPEEVVEHHNTRLNCDGDEQVEGDEEVEGDAEIDPSCLLIVGELVNPPLQPPPAATLTPIPQWANELWSSLRCFELLPPSSSATVGCAATPVIPKSPAPWALSLIRRSVPTRYSGIDALEACQRERGYLLPKRPMEHQSLLPKRPMEHQSSAHIESGLNDVHIFSAYLRRTTDIIDRVDFTCALEMANEALSHLSVLGPAVQNLRHRCSPSARIRLLIWELQHPHEAIVEALQTFPPTSYMRVDDIEAFLNELRDIRYPLFNKLCHEVRADVLVSFGRVLPHERLVKLMLHLNPWYEAALSVRETTPWPPLVFRHLDARHLQLNEQTPLWAYREICGLVNKERKNAVMRVIGAAALCNMW